MGMGMGIGMGTATGLQLSHCEINAMQICGKMLLTLSADPIPHRHLFGPQADCVAY